MRWRTAWPRRRCDHEQLLDCCPTAVLLALGGWCYYLARLSYLVLSNQTRGMSEAWLRWRGLAGLYHSC